ncbi:hypothetical protein LTR97_001201 [Elasticomyces elasticus]|uniref:S-adenosyl-L-methionine-dependent methyltransferase n=1 Tax=Elasticomyces elasticus TaxID=574655 RepID=A0AAN7WB79_9PEZI|nr:hypothetical protein LTR97_001201 [Elasticomyces elasticus]KAK5723629.1 hypothetical protein LTR15_005328 [Elasticomyces elasticus]
MATPGMHAPPDTVPSLEGSASAATAPPHEARDATTTHGGHDAETAAKQSGAGPSSHGASSLEPITPADTPSERPDDTDFIQHPVQVAQLAEEQELEAEDDADSALGSDTESATTTLSESIYNYRREHGRTYHAYKDGKYIFPNDDREADRLDLQHHIFRLTFGNRLYFAPVHEPQRCLDVGTGTGLWAIEFADAHPGCSVTGIDLSPGQPTLVPPNLSFLIDDAEDVWIYNHTFSFIHARLLAGCFADWPNFFRQAYQFLEPGGWLEMQDYGLPVKSADDTHLSTDILRWGELLCEAARNLGRPMGSEVSGTYKQLMQEAGFVDIETRMFMWPTNSWPRDPFMKELGRWNQVNILDGLEGFCLALLTRGLNWRKEEVDIFVANVSRDLRDRRIHAYFPMPVVFGRKPFPGEIV